MKPKIFYILITAALLGSAPAVLSQPTPVGATGSNAVPTTAAPPADANLLRYNALIREINSKLAAGQHTAAELAGDLSQFDVLLAAEGGRRTELAATIVWQKGVIYAEVLDDPDAALGLFQELKKNYTDTRPAADVDELLEVTAIHVEEKKLRATMPPGSHFPDFSVTNLDGGPLSVAQYKGRVVLVDFWATWCPPCRAEIPNIVATYDQYHTQCFEIVVVSLDVDLARLQSFTKDNHMPWLEYCDGQRFQGKLPGQYGVMAIPDNVLIDTNGNILAWSLRGPALPQAVAKALGK
jgi:thiol-disulfide isomerase/thioredoxin